MLSTPHPGTAGSKKMKPTPITAEEMALIEKRAEALGVPLELLMENAGASVAKFILEKFPEAGRIAVFCGTGNNGGDGFVAARHLAGLGFWVQVVLVGEPDRITKKEALLNWRITKRLKSLRVASFRPGMKMRADVAIDAMLGTGVHGLLLREPILSAVRLINSGSWKVVAVDTPTGLDPSDGKVAGNGAVKADYTVTFHRMKKGLLLKGQSGKYAGKLSVAGIGVPKEADVF